MSQWVMDVGNSSVKWAQFEERTMLQNGVGIPQPLSADDEVLVCASGEVPAELAEYPLLRHDSKLPIQLDYRTPHTLGLDRVAAACGAHALFPTDDCLIVDAGTCITVDYVEARGLYRGGAIMPGLDMQLQALHEGTARLPLIEPTTDRAPLVGRSTEECILAGTYGATMLALAGFVATYRQHTPQLKVLLTGGDADRLIRAGATAWQHVPHLTLIGLNEILIQHEE